MATCAHFIELFTIFAAILNEWVQPKHYQYNYNINQRHYPGVSGVQD